MRQNEVVSVRWKPNGLPRKGWVHVGVNVLDIGESDECDWCGTPIRFVHSLEHPEVKEVRKAGCVCAEHLTENYAGVRDAEKEARKRAARKEREKRSRKTNTSWLPGHRPNTYWRIMRGRHLYVFQEKVPPLWWRARVENYHGRMQFTNAEAAMCAAEDGLAFIEKNLGFPKTE